MQHRADPAHPASLVLDSLSKSMYWVTFSASLSPPSFLLPPRVMGSKSCSTVEGMHAASSASTPEVLALANMAAFPAPAPKLLVDEALLGAGDANPAWWQSASRSCSRHLEIAFKWALHGWGTPLSLQVVSRKGKESLSSCLRPLQPLLTRLGDAQAHSAVAYLSHPTYPASSPSSFPQPEASLH
jgi:hypothetical protein